MINIDVTRLSSKGQIVIPEDLRKDFSTGDKFVVIKSGHDLILKPVRELGKNFFEDIDFAKKTIAALKRYENGRFKEMDGEDFLTELEKW